MRGCRRKQVFVKFRKVGRRKKRTKLNDWDCLYHKLISCRSLFFIGVGQNLLAHAFRIFKPAEAGRNAQQEAVGQCRAKTMHTHTHKALSSSYSHPHPLCHYHIHRTDEKRGRAVKPSPKTKARRRVVDKQTGRRSHFKGESPSQASDIDPQSNGRHHHTGT